MRTVLEAWGALCAFTRTPAVARDFATKLLQPPVLIIIDGDETEGVSPLDELLAIKAPRLLMLPFGQTAPAAPSVAARRLLDLFEHAAGGGRQP